MDRPERGFYAAKHNRAKHNEDADANRCTVWIQRQHFYVAPA